MADGPELKTQRFPRRAEGAGVPAVRVDFHALIVNRSAGRFRYPRHQHSDNELIVADDGVYRCRLNGVELSVPPGHLLVVNAGDWHEDLCDPLLRFYAFQFKLYQAMPGEGGRPFGLLRGGLPPERQVFPFSRAVFWPLLERFMRESEKEDAFSGLIQDGIIQEIFWQLVRMLPAAVVAPQLRQVPEDYNLDARLRRLFERHGGRPLRVDAMAAELGMSTSSLAHRCRKLLGMTPARAFNQFRVERAAELLRHTGMSVKQISAYLGFPNQYHFSRVFKAHAGRAPQMFRDGEGAESPPPSVP